MSDPKISPETREFCSRLSALFRRLGSEVFRGKQNIKLTWTGYLHVQGALDILNSHHLVLEQKLVVDLEYLQSVLERISNLSITSRIRTSNPSWIHLSGLRSLNDLDLRNVSLDLVHGLDKLRDQLSALKISYCDVDLEDVLSHCLGDLAQPREWKHLTTLCLSHNKLTNLSVSLMLTPHLHTFLASHNELTQTTGLESLQRLHTLSLPFNSLTQIPSLSPECTLTSLSLGYNRLETLSGLECLIYLESLDITGNCLMHHDVLAPVSTLPRLRQLDTRYNPLSTHHNHRTITSSWLHCDVVNMNFLLDLLPLSKREILQVGTSRMMMSPPTAPREEAGEGFDLESASARGSREGSVVSGVTVTTVGGGRVRRKKKKRRIREALISDQPDQDEFTDTATSNTETEKPSHSEEGISDTVREMEKLRQRFGEDNWLREKSGETLNQLLGIQCSTAQEKEPVIQPSPPSSNSNQNSLEVTPEKSVSPPPPAEQEEEEPVKQDEADCFYSMYRQGEKETSPALSDECRLSVERMIPGDDSGDSEKLTLTINKEFIREQGVTGGTRVKWFLHSLEGCDMLKCEGGKVTAHLIFNTVRRDRRERVYILTEEGYARLVAATGSQLEQMSRGVSGLTYLQCIKCQSIFSQELNDNGNKKKSLVVCCVNCGSNMVIECDGPEKEEVDVSLGIPACEALDLENIENSGEALSTEIKKDSDSLPEKTYLHGVEEIPVANLARRSSSGKSLSIQVDIHDHEIKNPESSLPDLLPRQASKELSSGSGRKKSRSPTDIRSGSSSDISIISDNSIEVIQHTDRSTEDRVVSSSPSSIEVIHHTDTGESVSSHSPGSNTSRGSTADRSEEPAPEPETGSISTDGVGLLSSTTSAATLQASSSTVMQESSSSGSLVSSVILNTMVEQGKQDSEESSIQSSPTKKDDRLSEDESVYHSCASADETNISNPDISVHEGTPTQASTFSQGGSMCSTPCTVRSRTGSPASASTPLSKGGTPVSKDLNTSVFDSSKKFYSADNSLNVTLTPNEDLSSAEREKATKPFRRVKGQMAWNMEDFTLVDHRIRLFCEISLFHQEDEELLVVAKGDIFVKSALRMFNGLLVISNKKIYVMKGTEKESDEPRDWLEQLTSVPISRLQRLVQLLGGQGVALELSGGEGKPPSALYFGRLGGAGYSGLSGENCYYIILADSNATKIFIDQTVDLLQERVRSNPIPVVKELHYDEEQLLAKQIQLDPEAAAPSISSFHLALDSAGNLISVTCTADQLVLSANFFSWVFLERGTKLNVFHNIPVNMITELEIYQSLPESVSLRCGGRGEPVHLTFHSEKGLQRFVRCFRSTWEKENGKNLEEITGFHPTGTPTILKMSALMEESVSFKDFDFSQWIKVTTLKK